MSQSIESKIKEVVKLRPEVKILLLNPLCKNRILKNKEFQKNDNYGLNDLKLGSFGGLDLYYDRRLKNSRNYFLTEENLLYKLIMEK